MLLLFRSQAAAYFGAQRQKTLRQFRTTSRCAFHGGMTRRRKTSWTHRRAVFKRILPRTGLQRLYELVCKYRLTDIDREMTSQELADDKSKAVSMIPLEHYEISVTLNGRSLLICGDQTAVYHMTSDEDAANFINAVTSVKKAVTELPEWTALPPANGGYD